MALSALYILDQKGKILISRNYRGDVPFNSAERYVFHWWFHVLVADVDDSSSFITRILEEEEEANVKPIIEEEGISYLYVRHNNLYCKSQRVSLFFFFFCCAHILFSFGCNK